ncbi:MAG: type II toxin-antitoxin system prevent-host-death family antitoxin [Nitriliruptor sp.]|uniref:type II toxin-antitoxin system Phd/YefM family antitoxin n=1 Tax=Nitriliruptor sp. TaxID=2448056 RepID=UPI0034A009DB
MAEVGVAQFRRELKDWLERVRSGEEIVITERGRAVARLSGVDTGSLLDQLAGEGRISAPADAPRPAARNRPRATATTDVAELIVTERDARR